MALGRPPAIQDEWVTAQVRLTRFGRQSIANRVLSWQFPSDLDDSLITIDGLLPGPPSPSKQTAIHLFRIRKLQSSIIFRLYASGQTVRNPTNEWLADIQHSIEEWNDQKPRGRGFCSDEWLLLCYHQTTTLLHRPCPGNPTPSRDSLGKVLQGSSATMRLYKEVYRNGRISFGRSLFSSDQYGLMQRSQTSDRLAFDVPSVYLWGYIPQFTLARISKWMAACTILH